MRPYFRIPRSVGSGAALLIAPLTLFPWPVLADPGYIDPRDNQRYCKSYATAAANDIATSAQYGCYAQSNPRWNPKADHYGFCMSDDSDNSLLQEEKSSRALGAKNCSYCNSDDAAIASGARVLDNKLYNCGFTGPEWSDDPKVRLRACVNTPLGGPGIPPRGGIYGMLFPAPRATMGGERAQDVAADLQTQIDQCKAKQDLQMAGFCQNFATQAYLLANYYPQDIMSACTAGQQPRRWARDYNSQFQSCMDPKNTPFLADEQSARMTTILQCGNANGFAPPSADDLAFSPVGPIGGFAQSQFVPNPIPIPVTKHPMSTTRIFTPGSPNTGGPAVSTPTHSATPSPMPIPLTAGPKVLVPPRNLNSGGSDRIYPQGSPKTQTPTPPATKMPSANSGGSDKIYPTGSANAHVPTSPSSHPTDVPTHVHLPSSAGSDGIHSAGSPSAHVPVIPNPGSQGVPSVPIPGSANPTKIYQPSSPNGQVPKIPTQGSTNVFNAPRLSSDEAERAIIPKATPQMNVRSYHWGARPPIVQKVQARRAALHAGAKTQTRVRSYHWGGHPSVVRRVQARRAAIHASNAHSTSHTHSRSGHHR